MGSSVLFILAVAKSQQEVVYKMLYSFSSPSPTSHPSVRCLTRVLFTSSLATPLYFVSFGSQGVLKSSRNSN